jgi:Predicted SAM-dependent RNA methyltransferase
MRTLVGPQSHIHFTRLSTSSINALLAVFQNSTADTLAGVSCHDIGVLDLANQGGTPSITQICLLDPKADLPLSPEDGDGRFMWFLFGVSVHAFAKS